MSLPSASPRPTEGSSHRDRRERWDALASVLDTERRLLGDLLRVLLTQRKGLADDDLGALDGASHAAQRVLLTLQEAKAHRRALLRVLCRTEDAELADLEHRDDVPPRVLEARDLLLRAASELRRELGINRRAIHGAIHVGDRLIRTLAGSAGSAGTYAPAEAEGPRPGRGVLLDRQG